MKSDKSQTNEFVHTHQNKIERLKRLVEKAYFTGRNSAMDNQRAGEAWMSSEIKRELENI